MKWLFNILLGSHFLYLQLTNLYPRMASDNPYLKYKQLPVKTRVLNAFRNVFKVPFLESQVARWTTGKEMTAFVTKFPPNHYQYAKGSVRQAERNGIRYQLDISEFNDWHIYFGFQMIERKHLYQLVQPGMCILDIGGNIGEVGMNLAQLVGTQGQVTSFEPDMENYGRYESNLALNDFSNIQLVKKGLGTVSTTHKLYQVDPHNKGMNRILNEAEEVNHLDLPYTEISIIRLDDFVASQADMTAIDLIKIDVEGFEMEVLKGGLDCLKKDHPILFIELNNESLLGHGSSTAEVLQLLEEHGYRCFHAATMQPLDSKASFENTHFDIIAR